MTSPPAVERRHPPDAMMRLVNPVMRRLLDSRLHGRVSSALLLLHYRGRRSGRAITLPVGYHELADGGRGVFTNSGWRVNFRGGHDAEITLRGERHAVRGILEEEPDAVVDEYARIIDELGWKDAQRRLGLQINVERAPTREELSEAVRASGLSIVRLDPR